MIHTIGRMLEAVDRGGGVGAGVGAHPQVGAGHRGLPRGGVVHGRVVDSSAVLAGQRLDLLLQLLGVETVVHAPGVAGDGSPRVVRQARVPVVLHVGLGRHVLHLLKVQKSVEENYNFFDEMIKLQYIW